MIPLRPLRLVLLALSGGLLAAGNASAEVAISPYGPSSEIRSGGVALAEPTADGRWAVYLANQLEPRTLELFAVRTDAAGSTPIRLNRPLPLDSDVERFAIAASAGKSTVLYHADELTPGQYELFGYDLETGARRRLNGALPRLNSSDGDYRPVSQIGGGSGGVVVSFDAATTSLAAPAEIIPGDVHHFTVSRGGAWVLYSAADDETGARADFVTRVDGQSTPLRLAHAPLILADDGGHAFTPDDDALLVTREENGYIEIGKLDLATAQVAWLDRVPVSEAREFFGVRFLADGGALAAARLSENGLDQRHRWFGLEAEATGRWLTEPLESVRADVFLPSLQRLIVSLDDQTTTPETDTLRSYATDGSFVELIGASLGGVALYELMFDDAAGMVLWPSSQSPSFVPATGGSPLWLAGLAAAAGAAPEPGSSRVAKDKTGRVHWFFNSGGETWRMALAADAAPVRVAGFRSGAVIAVHAGRGEVVLGEQPSGTSDNYALHIASLAGAGSRFIGVHGARRGSSDAPAFLLREGGGLVFRDESHRLVLADWSGANLETRPLSPELPHIGSASLLGASPDGEWLAWLAHWSAEGEGFYLGRRAGDGGDMVRVGDGPIASWNLRWSPDGRFLLFATAEGDNWVAVDTANGMAARNLPASFYDRLVGLTADGRSVHARGSSELTFYTADLVTGDTQDVFVLGPALTNGATSLFPYEGTVTPGADSLVLKVDSMQMPEAIWRIPLNGGSPRLLADRPAMSGAGLGVLGADAAHAYVSVYDDAIYALPLDGAPLIRLTEKSTTWLGDFWTGAHNILFDLPSRRLAYQSYRPDGVPRFHLRHLDQPHSAGYPAQTFAITPGGARIAANSLAFINDGAAWVHQLGSTTEPVRVPLPSGATADSLELSPSGDRLLVKTYGAAGDALHLVNIAASACRRMTPPLPAGRYLGDFTLGDADDEVIFTGSLDEVGVTRAYRAEWRAAQPDDGLSHPHYAAWVVAENLPEGAEAAGEDADGDGAPNLLEFIHGSSGAAADERPGFQLHLAVGPTGWDELVYAPADIPADGWVRPQVSTDLVSWFDLPGFAAERLPTAPSARLEWLFRRPAGDRAFYRLRFTLPEPHAAGPE